VLLSIQALLSAPNPDDPLDNNVADHWKADELGAQNTGIYLYIIDLWDFFLLRFPPPPKYLYKLLLSID
jgi:hypothetical protein